MRGLPREMIDKVRRMKMGKSGQDCSVCYNGFHKGSRKNVRRLWSKIFRWKDQKIAVQTHFPWSMYSALVGTEYNLSKLSVQFGRFFHGKSWWRILTKSKEPLWWEISRKKILVYLFCCGEREKYFSSLKEQCIIL